MKLNKQMIKDLINEVVSEPSMLLEEPLIKESSFNRIKDKVDNTDISFVVMSADRHEKSRNENDVRNKELKAAWKAAGFPFTDIDGSWLEKDEDGNEVRVIEKSIVVTDEGRGDVEKGELDLFVFHCSHVLLQSVPLIYLENLILFSLLHLIILF